ncbi:hypothetical protein [Pseudonocardia sp.]|uniref:hypothetical protein n=1 Tax=Pseudonocardia sp. TaxID=60912 RepID=UPI00260C723E|nr:hypothetical protein [Pseudonocardia sp.]
MLAAVLGAATSVGDVEEAGASPGLFCRAESSISRSAPEVGAIYGQAGAFCHQPERSEAWVTAKLFRANMLISTRSNHCVPGRFNDGDYCTTPLLSASNPDGDQSFRLIVTVRYIPGPGARAVTTEAISTGTF